MKKFGLSLLILLSFALWAPAGVLAQNTIGVNDASGDPGSSGNIVRVDMSNDVAVSGIQFTLRAISPDLDPTDVRLGTRFLGSDFDISSNIFANGDSVRIVIVGLSGDSLDAGSGTIAEILYDVDPGASPGGTVDLTLADIVVSDPIGVEVEGTDSAGLFTFTTTAPTTLSADTAAANQGETGLITVSMDNPDTDRYVAALQFILMDVPDNLDVVDVEGIEVAAVGRASGFSVGANETEDGVVVTLTDVGGGSIGPGSGPIVTINYWANRGSGATSLDFSDVTISAPDAVEMPQGTHTSGSFEINLGPVAADDSEEADEDVPVVFNLISNDTDGDGDALIITAVTDPTNGTAVIDPGDSSVTYTPDPDYNSDIEGPPDSFTYTISDGNGGTDTGEVTVEVFPINDAPVVTAPDTEVTDEDTDRVFSDSNDNEIRVEDIDADEQGPGLLLVILTASSTLTLNPSETEELASLTGDGTSTVTMTGTASEINAVLDGLRYSPDENENGVEAGSLNIVVDDRGNYGDHEEDSLTDTHVISIDINAVNDAPEIHIDQSVYQIVEDSNVIFSSEGEAITISDVDAHETEGALVEVSLTAASTITLDNAGLVTVTDGADGTSFVSFTGSVDDVNDAMDGMIYAPDPDSSGLKSLTVDVSDLGNTGSPGSLSDQEEITISVSPVNDPPEILTEGLADAFQDLAYVFFIEAEDVEGAELTYSLGVHPDWLSIDPETGELGGTPTVSDTGNVDVEVRVSDGPNTPFRIYGLNVNADRVSPEFVSGPSDQGVTDTQFSVVFSSSEPVTGVVRYGVADQQSVPPSTNGTLALTDSVVIGTPANDQSADITGLTGSTTYEYEVEISDGNGNTTTSGSLITTTLASPDSTEPNFVKLPQAIARTDSALTIAWEADEASTAIVRLVRANGDTIAPNIVAATASFSFSDQVTITGLDPLTTYDGQVELTDASGNGPATEPFDNNPARVTATTRATPDVRAPVFTANPTVKGLTDNKATILSSTNEPAGIIVQYGLTPGLGSQVIDSTAMQDQSVTLTGLTADSTHYFRVRVFDGSGNNSAFTATATFQTKAAPDVAPPIITSGPSVLSVTDASIIVQFETNELGNTALRYKVAGGTDSTTITRPELVTNHVVTLTGLTPETIYEYAVSSKDGSGNTSDERRGTVRTLQAPDTQPPKFLTRPTVTFKSSDRFRVEWESDEASGSFGQAGITAADTSLEALDQDLVKKHVLTFTDLDTNTVYFWRVSMSDANGNRTISGIDSIRTSPAPDVAPPAISSITANAELSQAVLAFTTSEPGNTRIIVGTDSASVATGDVTNTDVFEDPAFVVNHSVAVTGLSAATKHYYRVQSSDPSGNESALLPTTPRDFTTDAAPDVTPPVISGVTASGITATEATITFGTDELAGTSVSFDTTSGTLHGLAQDPELVTAHSVTLTNLKPGQTYHYRVSATDQSDNSSESPGSGNLPKTFTTVAVLVDSIPPLFIERPNLDYTSNTTAIISFKTDEPTDAVIFYKEDLAEFFTSIPDPAGRGTDHDLSIGGLNRGSTYDFVAQATDAAGNTGSFPNSAIVFKVGPNLFKIVNIQQGPGTNGRFTTLQAPDTQAPVILNGPTITSRDDDAITIQWSTDELSTSTVDFGTDSNNLDQRTEDGSLVTTHSINITGLSPSTVYSYAVNSTDPSNNGPSTSTQAVVSTTAQPDIAPPVISAGPDVSTTFVSTADGASATITWTTDEPADTKVEFGTTPALGEVKAVSEAVSAHSVTLTRLTADASFNYRVSSTDQTGNGPTTSGILSFTAASQLDTQSPTISNISTSGSTNDRIVVTWDTDEIATTILLAIEQGTTETITVSDGAFVASHSISITQDNSGNAIKSGTVYDLVVESLDASDNVGLQNTSVTTAAAPDVTAPAVPSNVAATPGNTQIQVTWDTVGDSDLSGYDVYRDGTRVASGVTQTTYDATGLTNGTSVDFAVQSVDQSGNSSSNSSTVSATPLATLAPSAPTPIGTFDRSGNTLTTVSLKPILIVDNATPVDGRAEPTYTFVVYGDVGLTNLVASTSGVAQGVSTNPTHWQVTDPTLPDDVALVNGTTYYWRARANDGVADGDWSSTVSFIASSEVETAIELTTFSAETDRGMVTLSWQTVLDLGIEGFKVYRSVNTNGPFELVSSSLIRGEDGAYEFNDHSVAVNVIYYYQIEVKSTLEEDRRFGPISVKVAPPNSYSMQQNYPNPFNPTTTVRYELPQSGHVELTVYNILGQEVRRLVDSPQDAGFHTIQWNGLSGAQHRVSSGLYLYRISVKVDGQTTFSSARKMLLLK